MDTSCRGAGGQSEGAAGDVEGEGYRQGDWRGRAGFWTGGALRGSARSRCGAWAGAGIGAGRSSARLRCPGVWLLLFFVLSSFVFSCPGVW